MVWGPVAGGIAGALTNRIFGGGKSEIESQRYEYPSFIKDASKDVIARGQELADQPYERYPGQRIAEWGPAQGAAYDMTFGSMGNWMPYLNQGAGYGGLAMSYAEPSRFKHRGIRMFDGDVLEGREIEPGVWDAETARNYMNPYISEALNPAVRDAQIAFASDILGDRRSAAAEGAFGGSRQAILDQENRRRAETGIGDMLSRGYADAYQSGLGAFQQDANRRLTADTTNLQTAMWEHDRRYRQEAENRSARERAFGLNEDSRWNAVRSLLQGGDFFNRLGQLTSSLGASDISRMWQAGDREQRHRQMQVDQDYADWVEARDWNARGMDYLIRALGGTPYGSQPSQVNTYGPGTNPGAQVAGLVTAGAGLWDHYRNSVPPPPGGGSWAPYHADPYPGTSGR